MNLPLNGRVVVIDDEVETEGLPLVKALSRNGVSTTFFTGLNFEELPPEPLQDVRLVFLDIVIGTRQSPKNQVATVGNILRRIIGPQNSPYILIAWTKHSYLLPKIKSLPGVCPPIFTLNLEKLNCKDKQGNFNLKKIESKLKKELEKAGIFHLFVLWENTVHKSANQIISELTSFYDYNDEWNKNLSDVIFHLAKAHAGQQIEKNDKREIIVNGLLTFNGTFIDTLENSIRDFNPAEINIKFDSSASISEAFCAKINPKLLLIDSLDTKTLHPGNVYEIKKNEGKHKIEIRDLFNGNLDEYDRKDEFINRTRCILLEVSPFCDFAQNKWKMSRLLLGVMWPKEHYRKIKKGDFIYTTPPFEIDSNVFKLVFNLRYLKSLSFNILKKEKPIFRIKHQLLVDIQSHLARHISRPGVISLD